MTVISTHKKLIINTITVITSILISQAAYSQILGGEQNPLSVKWRKINASGFQLVYPSELENEAQRMANTLTTIYPHVGSSLGRQQTNIPILLQNRGVIANGFVQLAPKKSEFFTTPPQQFDSQDWLNNLAVHELRHVAQFDKLTGTSSRPFPEELHFAWIGASIPLWFLEGDAVSTETALTRAGRGRQPSWIMPYRTNLLEGKNFPYTKANFSSEKDVTPGYYQLGYLIASKIRKEYGENIFDSILTDINKRPLRIYPFSNSLKKFTGASTLKWYKNTTEELKIAWKKQDQKTPSFDYPLLNFPSKFATDYSLPVRIAANQTLALKQSKAEPAHFVIIDSNQKEKKLLHIGIQEQPWFSYAAGTIVWDEIRYDPRFRQRSYSVICSYHIPSGSTRKLTSKSRIFSPALSPDGKTIIAVQFDLSNQCNLIEMEAASGHIIRTYANPGNLILQMPSYDSTGNSFTYVSVSESGKALWIGHQQGEPRKIINETQQQLGRPVFIYDQIAFNAHYNGIDNIYSIDTVSGNISALTASKYGAFNPSVSSRSDTGDQNRSIVFNNYGFRGYGISETTIKPKPLDSNHFVYFGAAAETLENSVSVFDRIPDSTYTSTAYRKLGHLFNVHSISPIIENEYRGGLQIKSHNLLNTFNMYGGVNYYRDLKRFEYYTGFSLKSFYPIFNASYRNQPKRTFYRQGNAMKQGDWRENHFHLSALLPLNLNALNHNYNFSLNLGTSYTKRYAPENLPENYITRLEFPMEYRFTFTHSVRRAERDVAPKWGQTLRFSYFHQPFDQNLEGELFAAEGFFYFPGVAKNHTLLANFNYQKASGVRRYATEINTVYGYSNIKARSPLSNTLLLNYRFPFAFPDAEIGPLAYIRNLRAGLFCHYENLGIESNIAEPKTYGFEIRSSMNLLRYQPVFDLGTRFVFVNKLYNQNPILELILNYSF